MRKLTTMREALADKALLAGALPGPSWRNWRILLIAAVGERLTASERKVFTRLTGRPREPGCMVDVFMVVAGRRSGKSKVMSCLSVYLACLCDWSFDLSLGETGTAMYLAPTEKQAGVVHDYAVAIVDDTELLRSMVESRTASSLVLHRRIVLETMAASWRTVRGGTAISICLDESAFLHGDDSANSDTELLTALRPSLATTGGMMMLTSSPAAMEGIVYKLFERHHGEKGDRKILVVQADSKTLNPNLRQDVIDRAFEHDPVGAESEYGGVFRQPAAAYLERAVVEKAVDKGIGARTALPGVNYLAFVDVAGGSGADAFACAIGHVQRHDERDVAVVDAVFENRPPFDPNDVTARCAALLKSWGVNLVMGDSYAAMWPVTAFAKHGIQYQASPLTTSEQYLHVIPLFTSGRALLVDQPRLIDQLCGLRRKVGQAGRETVDHRRGAHDDVAAAVCGLLWRLSPPTPAPPTNWPIFVSAREMMEPTAAWSAKDGYVPARDGASRFDNNG